MPQSELTQLLDGRDRSRPTFQLRPGEFNWLRLHPDWAPRTARSVTARAAP
jgi:hypothetical protein